MNMYIFVNEVYMVDSTANTGYFYVSEIRWDSC